MPDFLSILDHEAWDEAVVVGGNTAQEAEDAAERLLLEETAEYRDMAEWPDDADWIDVCLSEGWTIRPASFK